MIGINIERKEIGKYFDNKNTNKKKVLELALISKAFEINKFDGFPFSIAITLLITKNKKKRTTIISKNCFGPFQTFRYRYPRIKKKKKAAIVSKGFEINKFDLMDFNACISISIAVATYSTNKKRESPKGARLFRGINNHLRSGQIRRGKRNDR